MSEEILDVKEVLERVQEDRELLLELFDIFQEDFKEKRGALDTASQSKDFEGLKNIAHSMKGAASNISAKKIYKSFAELEDIANGGDASKIGTLLGNIDSEYSELLSQIEKVKKDFNG